MTNKQFKERLALVPTFKGDKERQVEAAYNEMLKEAFPSIAISNPFKCDGYFQLTTKTGKVGDVIIEYKYDEEMSSDVGRAKVLAQVLFYLKKIEKSEFPLPSVVLVGDVNECFVLHVNPLLKYLDFEGVDWSKAASSAGNNNPDLVLAISKDENLNTWVYDIDDNFDFNEIADKIENIVSNVTTLVHITEHNIDRTFDEFDKHVLKGKCKLSANDKVGVFMGCIVDVDNFYLHPKKANVLVTPNGEIAVDGKYFDTFFKRYDQNVPPFERRKLAEICDRLIEDETRRKKGEFYTPTAWVDYAHSRVEKVLGQNWKEECVVWDCCCGTKNLTRDYVFRELYCSTLEQSELDISEKYNPPKDRSFVFDFLNDELKRQSQGGKVPDGLIDALEGGKRIVFLINPPYATACDMQNGASKGGVCKTKMNEAMNALELGVASANLYAQFLYRIITIKKQYGANVSIGLFCNPKYLSGPAYKKFRKIFLEEFKYEEGFLFNAGHFSDTASTWGISFTIWTSGNTADKNNFKHDLTDTNENGDIVKVGEKVIYNSDTIKNLGEWIKEIKLAGEKGDFPNLSSGIVIKANDKKWIDGSLGTYFHMNNDIYHSAQGVLMSSGVATVGKGTTCHISMKAENFLRCTSAFTARKLIENTWINQKDEYLAPNEAHPDFHRFEIDSVVYSLFHSSSQQSSLRNVRYKGKTWDIPNQFFFMSHTEMEKLANENNLQETYEQVRLVKKETYVYDLLTQVESELSPKAREVLEAGRDLVRKSMKYRELFNMENPSANVLNWDIGFYQVKLILKQYLPDELKKFRDLYKEFSEQLRPLVFELGFLKK